MGLLFEVSVFQRVVCFSKDLLFNSCFYRTICFFQRVHPPRISFSTYLLSKGLFLDGFAFLEGSVFRQPAPAPAPCLSE